MRLPSKRVAAAVAGIVALMGSTAGAQEAVGDWNGLLQVGGVELRIGVKIEPGEAGALKGSLSSPDQGAGDIPISDVRMDQGKLSFAVPTIRGRYEGEWDATQGGWKGRWIQGGPIPLTLAKGPVPSRARPQMPAKPIAYDPRSNLAKLRMPVLAVNGANDLQVVASQNLPAIREALKANKDVTAVELPGLNHLFQTSATGDPREYGRIEETFAPAALQAVGDWIVARTGARP